MLKLTRSLQMTFAAAMVSCWHEKEPLPRAPNAVSAPPAASAAATAPPGAPQAPPQPAVGWLETPLAGSCAAADDCELPSFDTPAGDMRVLAVGRRTIVLGTRLGVFVLTSEFGVAGPVSLPGDPDPLSVRNIGLGTFDRLVYADPDGRVWIAGPGIDGFEARGQVPGALDWDFAHGILAAVTEDAVWVSEDGNYFRRIDFPSPRHFRDVFVRDDGTIVVRGHRGIEISHDRGWDWFRSELEGSMLAREGQWISICNEATLCADGRSWVKTPARPFDESRWFATLKLCRRPSGFVEESLGLGVLQTPPAAKPRAKRSGHLGCSMGKARLGTLSAPPKRPAPLVSVPPGLHTVAAWPVAPRVPATRTVFAFLADGACERQPAQRDRVACPAGTPFTRPPRIAAVDRVSFRVSLLSVPQFCAPQEIADASGAAILTCGSPGQNRTVQFISRTEQPYHNGAPQIEDQVPLRVGQSRDGSVAVVTAVDALTVVVRAPRAVGAPDAWRRVRVDDAVAYRVADAAAIVAVTAPSSDAGKFSLVLVSPVGTESTLASDLDIGEGVEAVDVDGSEVVVRRRTRGGPPQEARFAMRW